MDARNALATVLALANCLAAACPGGSEDVGEDPPRTIPEPEETDAPDPKAHMQQHHTAALRARDAVIAGMPAAAQKPLRWLAGHIYPDTLPSAFLAHAERMRGAARAAAEAADTERAAQAIGRLAATCGGCHDNIDGGPRPRSEPLGTRADEDLPDRMQRHAWAAERMWEGLITPRERAWTAGARALAEGRLVADANEALSDEVRAELEEVRILGRRALRETGWASRAELYGTLLSTCAHCHRSLGVRLDHATATETPTRGATTPP